MFSFSITSASLVGQPLDYPQAWPTMPGQDLTASRWASPEVRREREYQDRTTGRTTTRTPSPQKHDIQRTGSHSGVGHAGRMATSTATAIGTSPATGTGTGRGTDTGPSATQALSTAQRLVQTRQTELQRFGRLFRRLAWKANSLTHWSHRALSLAQDHQSREEEDEQHNHSHHTQQHHHHAHPDARQDDREPPSSFQGRGPRTNLGRYEMVIDPVEAERQFKIDFYEFYALLERGLVCLLGVWGIVITSTSSTTTITPTKSPLETSTPTTTTASTSTPQLQRQTSIVGDSRTFHGSAHRFHANVLAALDHPSNPLHGLLGTGQARAYIGVAKEFRNKWKDVEQRPDGSFVGHDRADEVWDAAKVKRYEDVLRDLKLDELLGGVLEALEVAGREAENEVRRLEALLVGSASVSASGEGAGRGGLRGGGGREMGLSDLGTAGGVGPGVGFVGYDEDLDMEDAPFELVTEHVELDFDMEL